jgi:transcription elongation factor GreA
MSDILFTQEAYTQLKQDLEFLQKEEKEILIRLQAAREMGDLSENGAYKYAKFELGSVRRQKNKVTYLLQHGKVGQKSTSGNVGFGSEVTISDGTTEQTYMLVSKHESNPAVNKISVESPIGKALLHHQAGDQITFSTPQGEKSYTIIKVS